MTISMLHETLSTGQDALSYTVQAVQHSVHQVVEATGKPKPPKAPAGGNLNPAPAPPKGIGTKASDLMGNVKWGSLVVIIACGFIGAGAIAGGKFLSHHKTSQFGVGALLAAVIAAVVWVGIYPFLKSITG